MATKENRPDQAVRPIPESLPPHIAERDEIARRAGLSVEHAWWNLNASLLVSSYRGPLEVLLASPFIEHRGSFRLPSGTRHPGKAGVADFEAPTRVVGVFREAAGMAVVKYRDCMPETFGTLDGGTVFSRFDWREQTEYIGSREQLLADGVATDADFRECPPQFDRMSHAAKESLGYRLRTLRMSGERVLSDCTPLGRGRYVVTVNLDAQRKDEQERERLDAASTYANADDFRAVATTLADVGLVGVLAALERPGHDADGNQYRFSRALRERVMRLAAELRNEIASTAVQVQRNEPEPMRAPMGLPPDASFQRFLGKLLPD